MKTQDKGTASVLVEDRWRTLTIGVNQSDGSDTNSELMARLMADFRELAGRMVHGISDVDDGAEYSALCAVEHQWLVNLEDSVKRFAVEIVEMRWVGRP